MRDLRLIGVQEDGQHLLLSDSEGDRFRVPLDEPLRAAVRRDRARLGQLQIEIDGGLRPREVQALVRGGLSAEEVAERSGWAVEKVRRYEGPILAEREYVAGLARAVRLRGRTGGGASTPTLLARVSQRLSGRGVDPASAEWDSARDDNGAWTVLVTFPAGGRVREARWAFDVQARTVTAADDEARWLSEEDGSGVASPLPAPHLVSTPVRSTTVYDVEAEGGVASPRTARQRPASIDDEPLDLMSAMRERASHRGRPRRRKATPAQTPLDEAPRDDALPLDELAYDPESMPPPPAARGTHPHDGTPVEQAPVEPAPVAPAEAEPEPASGPQARTPAPEPAVEAAPEAAVGGEPEVAAGARDDGEFVPQVAPRPLRRGARRGGAADSVGDDVLPSATTADDAADDDQPDAEPARPARKSGRPSVPSWDDVMFGAKNRD